MRYFKAMTRTEIEKQALSLPAAEREALYHALRVSLLKEGLPLEEDQGALERLQRQFEAQVEAGFASGEGRVWTDEDWAKLKRGEYQHPPEEDSWATPPGWKSPRLRQGD